MKIVWFSIVGVVVQTFWLLAFILLSRTGLGGLGKDLIIVLASANVGILLWHRIKRTASFVACVFLFPAILALGYTISFHLLGLAGFPGLLSDVHPPYAAYLWSVARITLLLTVAYALLSGLMLAISRTTSGVGGPR